MTNCISVTIRMDITKAFSQWFAVISLSIYIDVLLRRTADILLYVKTMYFHVVEITNYFDGNLLITVQ